MSHSDKVQFIQCNVIDKQILNKSWLKPIARHQNSFNSSDGLDQRRGLHEMLHLKKEVAWIWVHRSPMHGNHFINAFWVLSLRWKLLAWNWLEFLHMMKEVAAWQISLDTDSKRSWKQVRWAAVHSGDTFRRKWRRLGGTKGAVDMQRGCNWGHEKLWNWDDL